MKRVVDIQSVPNILQVNGFKYIFLESVIVITVVEGDIFEKGLVLIISLRFRNPHLGPRFNTPLWILFNYKVNEV